VVNQGNGGAVPGRGRDRDSTRARILAGARRLLLRKGYDALHMKALEDESGVNRGLVHYYFGGKAGLVEALVEAVIGDLDARIREQVLRLPADGRRLRSLLESQRALSADVANTVVLAELLPRVLRDPRLRQRMAHSYEAARALDAWCLGEEGAALTEEDRGALAALLVAVLDGLGVQAALDPDGLDHARAFALWADMVERYLAWRREEGDEPRRDPAAGRP